ncbi:MAG: hypothetical protein WD877_01020 [Candidatus Saccharimonadales bacterium]
MALFAAIATACGTDRAAANTSVGSQFQIGWIQQDIQLAALKRAIKTKRRETWQWQDSSLTPRTPTDYKERTTKSPAFLEWIRDYWAEKLRKAKKKALNPPHKPEWECIHGHEAAWDNPGLTWQGYPSRYYGGLQMDRQFMATYGAFFVRKYGGRVVDGRAYGGEAHLWTPHEQMWVAEMAHRVRGFNPWPNTAPKCGLPT